MAEVVESVRRREEVSPGARWLVAVALLAVACAGRGPQRVSPEAAASAPVLRDHGPPPIMHGDATTSELGAPMSAPVPPPPSSPPRALPRTWVSVPAGEIVQARTHGSGDIEPDDATRAELARTGRHTAGTFRLCFDDAGTVVLTRAVIRTAFPAYDEKILEEIRAWKFRPHELEGEPTGVCSEVSVAYPPPKATMRR